MARGWESKQVESQMEDGREKHPAGGAARSADDKETEREKQNLLLSRAYIQHQIESSSNSRYIESLNKALEEIERKLAALATHS
jgi:ribosomal protein L20